MKKTILLGLITSCALSFSAHAQDLKRGGKAGFKVAKLKTDENIS